MNVGVKETERYTSPTARRMPRGEGVLPDEGAGASLKIGFITYQDPHDVLSYSGSTFHMLQALERRYGEVPAFGNLERTHRLRIKIRRNLIRRLTPWTFYEDRDHAVLKSYSRQLEAKLAGHQFDVLISPTVMPVAFLQTSIPIVTWTDCTFIAMQRSYPLLQNMSPASIREGNIVEQRCIDRCLYSLYCSEWAAESARTDYHGDPARVGMIPYGANMEAPFTTEEAEARIEAKSISPIKLLFVGIEWERKGGAKAVAVAQGLHDRGIPVELHLVGTNPPTSVPDFVKVHGFVSKRTPEGREFLHQLFSESHFMIVPSIAECFGVVFSEASAYGLPSLSNAIGGITTAIQNGINGYTFPLEAPISDWVDRVAQVVSTEASYRELARSARRDYDQRLNWDSAVTTLDGMLRRALP